MAHWNTLELRKFLGPVVPHSREERECWIRKTWDERRKGTAYTFAIEDNATHQFLGTCALKNVRPTNRSAEVSLAIYDPANRGLGYGTDALQLLLQYGFNYLNLHRVGLSVFYTNEQALKVYERVGFRKVGVKRHTDFIDGQYFDDVIMDILEDEWKSRPFSANNPA